MPRFVTFKRNGGGEWKRDQPTNPTILGSFLLARGLNHRWKWPHLVALEVQVDHLKYRFHQVDYFICRESWWSKIGDYNFYSLWLTWKWQIKRLVYLKTGEFTTFPKWKLEMTTFTKGKKTKTSVELFVGKTFIERP